MKEIDKLISLGIYALIPIYKKDFGNATEIIVEDGTSHIMTKTLKSILRLICRYYGVDLNSTRTKYGKIIDQKNIIPLPLCYNIVLIPIKMRKSICLKDGSYGYVNYFSIEDIIQKDEETYIKLRNENMIKCLCSLKTAKDHFNNGKIIVNDESFTSQFNATRNSYYFYEEYNSPATKGDIAGLKKDIVEIKETLRKNR